MADILVLDWMEEYDSLTESEIHTYATEQEHNQEVMLALFALLEEPQQSRKTDLIERICKQFLNFYRSGEKSLRRFVMQYIPSFVWLHLSAKEVYPEIETLLLSLYNLEVVDGNGQSKIISFRVPSLAQNSIYHDSSTLEPAFIAENSLRRYEECNTKLVNWGPLPQVESLNAQNRQRVVTALVFLYNQDASSVPATNVECICRVISKIINQGFQMGGNRTSTDSENSQTNSLPRLIVSNTLLLELLHIVYNALQRGINGASQTLRDIYQRATYETYADVLLATHALQSLVHQTPTANLHLKPPSKPHVSKSMITNASFRTKKLPGKKKS
ncbi:hyccin isoform X2 [Onthophagus taurus]|uniref:hyccin isoform X2 n=1 Tax=Onthophagus taurus TaxID=166361 RepID=UPI0039BDADEC